MSGPATTQPVQPQSPAAQPQNEAKPLKITRKVREAILAMVWEGLKRDAAATKAGIKDNSLYVALRRPDVKAFYLRELDVLRTSERARNIHTLAEVRDQTSNQMARVQAVKALEQLADDESGASVRANSLPGLQIVIQTGGPQPRNTSVRRYSSRGRSARSTPGCCRRTSTSRRPIATSSGSTTSRRSRRKGRSSSTG
jgi:hypothetical protein